VIVLVKSYDTAGAIPLVEKILAPEGVVLTLQNGIGNFEILEKAFPKRVLLGTTTIGAMTVAKGKARHTGLGQTHLGQPDGSITPRAEKVVATLGRMNAGPVHVTDNAMGSVWSKLMINASINAPATLLRVRNGDLPATESGRELIHKIVAEGLAVAKAKGIKLLFEDTEGQVLAVCKGTAPNINSMFQDILASRRTEIDFINGALAREGALVGVPTPINETLALLMRSLESTASVRV
jgi:2-dehydropantoate 2-reductase